MFSNVINQKRCRTELEQRFPILPDAETWHLCTSAKLNLRILGEVEKNRFLALPGKDRHSRLLPSKLCVLTQEDLMKSFTVIVQEWRC